MTGIRTIEVVWDGTRVYRVPFVGEIEAVRLLGLGHSTRQASQLLGLTVKDGARRRADAAQSKMHAVSHADTLLRMCQLGFLDFRRDDKLEPVLSGGQMHVFDLVVRLGMTCDDAHPLLGVGRNTLARRMSEVCTALGSNGLRCHTMERAIAHGDVVVDPPAQLWRGMV